MTASARGGLELADVIRTHLTDYLARYDAITTVEHKRVLGALTACRTAALGGHKSRCDHCGHEEIAYNSCRNRHCPKCQAAARHDWLEARSLELLPVPYYHVVFTLPEVFGPLALQNKRIVYDILFRSASKTLLQIAADPKHLGAQIGFLAVLHTWGQNLMHHPHLHCVVPGGGLSPEGSRWILCKDGFFLPVRVLSKVFRGKFIAALRQACRSGELQFHGQLAGLRQPDEFERLICTAVRNDWVVYAKPPFGGPQHVLKYLARYTHRVAISNSRLLAMQNGKVTFRWKDYAEGSHKKTMTLDATEFIRRFLIHVLPTGFMRIRHFGFLANRSRRTKLGLCRQHLGVADPTDGPAGDAHGEEVPSSAARDEKISEPAHDVVCPTCKTGRMVTVEVLPRPIRNDYLRTTWRTLPTITAKAWDTS